MQIELPEAIRKEIKEAQWASANFAALWKDDVERIARLASELARAEGIAEGRRIGLEEAAKACEDAWNNSWEIMPMKEYSERLATAIRVRIKT